MPILTDIDSAEQQLLQMAGGDPEKAAMMLALIEEDRRGKEWVRYWQPQGDQIKFWQELEANPDAKIWVLSGGKRSGKSECGTFLGVAWLMGKEFFKGYPAYKWVEPLPIPDRPTIVRTVALTNDNLRDLWTQKLMSGTDHPPYIPPSEVDHSSENLMTITLKRESRWYGKSAEIERKKHGGVGVDLVHIDEECSKEIFDENYQRTISTGGRIVVTATPMDDIGTTADPWLFDLVKQAESGDKSVLVVKMWLENNPANSPEEVAKLKARLEGASDRDAVLYGEFTQRAGLVYPSWAAAPPLWVPPHDLPNRCLRAVMVDPASSGPVGAAWVAVDTQGNYCIYRTYKESKLTASEHVTNILLENAGDPIDLWLMDPYMGAQKLPWSKEHGDERTVLQVYRDAGLGRLRLANVNAAMGLEESRLYLKAAFDRTDPHPRVEVFNTCTHFRQEIEKYVNDTVSRGPSRGEVKDRPRKGFDDIMNCFQYLCAMRLRFRPLGANVGLVRPEFRSYNQ